MQKISIRQHVRWLPADTETPISLYMGMAGNRDGVLLESAEVDGRWGRYSILAFDMAFFISCAAGEISIRIEDEKFSPLAKFNRMPFLDGLRAVLDMIEISPPAENEDLPPITRALYGYMGFGMAALFNPCLAKCIPGEQMECSLALPRTVLVFDHLYNRLCQLSLGSPMPVRGEKTLGELPPRAARTCDDEGREAEYKNMVKEIKEKLRAGEAIQVVPSMQFSADFHGQPFDLYRSMRRRNASPYMFYMHFPDIILFGSSPEVMVRCEHDRLQLSPIAGTRKRGKNDIEDRALAEELLSDPKERAEHVMLVDLGRNDLGRIAKKGTVKVDRFMEIERFSHVMHITSSLSACLDSDRRLDALDVIGATFPAGTVSGAPKMRAMEIICRQEKRPRGPYAGCIGWIGLDRGSVNLDMGITIRSMWVRDGKLFWQAGGGIVHDSDPELEWKEVCNKSAIMRLALKEDGECYVPSHR